jgi:hypothetical protein
MNTVTDAKARLEQSRARLFDALMPPEDAARSGAAGPKAARSRSLWRLMRRRLQGSGLEPLLHVAETGARRWWGAHPWRRSAELVLHHLQQDVRPWVRRHPWATVGLGASAGAAVVLLGPWRWPSLRLQARRLAGLGAAWLVAQGSRPAVQTALAVWLEQQRQRLRSAAAVSEAADKPSAPGTMDAPAATPDDDGTGRKTRSSDTATPEEIRP